MCAYTNMRQELQHRSREHSNELTPIYASHAEKIPALSAKLSVFRVCVGSASFAQNGVGSHTCAKRVLGRNSTATHSDISGAVLGLSQSKDLDNSIQEPAKHTSVKRAATGQGGAAAESTETG